jgi:hypothetical protein
MGFKGTKGKWGKDCGIDLLGRNDELMQIIVYSKEVKTHSVAHVFGLSQEEVEANANIISCSKDMFNVLKDIYDDVEVWTHLFPSQQQKIEQLIKKATE